MSKIEHKTKQSKRTHRCGFHGHDQEWLLQKPCTTNDHSKDHGHGIGNQRRKNSRASGVPRSANQRSAAPATAAPARSSRSAWLWSKQSIVTKDHGDKIELTVNARLWQSVPLRCILTRRTSTKKGTNGVLAPFWTHGPRHLHLHCGPRGLCCWN